MAEPLGFDPLKRPPSDGRFSDFLRSNTNGYFQIIRQALVQVLINEGVISGQGVGLDSCPIEAFVKENNFKTSTKDRYEKHHLPRGDKDARLGVSIHFPSPFKRKVHYFCGYRNHIITDLDSELPIVEITLQANKDEKNVALPMLNRLYQEFSLPIEVVAGDANYDVEAILRYIIEEMKAVAMIPRRTLNMQNTPYPVKRDTLYCQPDLPMHLKGKMTTNGITYLQYSCPLQWSKEFKRQYLLCPAGHPKIAKTERM